MDMDDPWGSPWADEVQVQQPPHPAAIKESHALAAEGPKTPVKASSLALQQQTSSPWDDANSADDNGSGDWAAVPSEAGIGLDGAQDGWGRNLGDDIHVTKNESNGLSAAWNGLSTVPEQVASGLEPSLLPKATDIARQPSPDRWAFDAENNEKPELDMEQSNQEEHFKDMTSIANGNADWDTHDSQFITNGDSKFVNEAGELSIEEVDTIEVPSQEQIFDGMGDHASTSNGASGQLKKGSEEHQEFPEIALQPGTEASIPSKQAEELENMEPGTFNEIQNLPSLLPSAEPIFISHEADPMSSRPSTSPSELSHHEEIFSESPRTSLEEDPTRPHVPRKVSSKVQELVEHFDTLAKHDEAPEIGIGLTDAGEDLVESTKQPHDDDADKEEEAEEVNDEDIDDFGDFEDGQSEVDEPFDEPAQTSSSPVTPSSKVAPKVLERDLQESPEIQTPRKEYGPADFYPDASLLVKLYPHVEDEQSPESCFIPDKVPHDSFTSTEQRKTWYRVSRYGPMRKHNMGDDENYTRVNWIQSEIRAETLKIVARWIEEDRISGRVVLGGGSKAGSMFGWNDQKPAPPSISAAFASKTKKVEVAPVESTVEVPREWPKGLVRDRSTSKGRSSSKPRRKSSVKSVKPLVESKVESPVASFGWSIVPEISQKPHSRGSSSKGSLGTITNAVSTTNSPSPPRKRSSLKRSSSSATTFNPMEPIDNKSVPAVKAHLPPLIPKQNVPSAAPSAAVAQFSNDDDDDGWGEMISSPTTSAQPTFSLPNSLRHKKSQSLGGAFSPLKPSLSPISPIQSMNSGRGHRSTLSFDQIFKPETRSSQSPQIPSSAFATPSNTFPSPIAQIAPALPTGSNDPWASADFSFFDTVSTPPLKTAHAPLPTTLPTKTVSFPNSGVTASPKLHRSKEEIENDRIVQSVVKGLPNLSYMLRR